MLIPKEAYRVVTIKLIQELVKLEGKIKQLQIDISFLSAEITLREKLKALKRN